MMNATLRGVAFKRFLSRLSREASQVAHELARQALLTKVFFVCGTMIPLVLLFLF
jgi:hypothetical protein